MTSIPDFVGDYNITMGFPLKNTKPLIFLAICCTSKFKILTDSLSFM